MGVDKTPSPEGAPNKSTALDSWEDAAEDDEEDMEEDEEEEISTRAKRKQAAACEDTKTKKEHVNVVFIGHVGKLLPMPICNRHTLVYSSAYI